MGWFIHIVLKFIHFLERPWAPILVSATNVLLTHTHTQLALASLAAVGLTALKTAHELE